MLMSRVCNYTAKQSMFQNYRNFKRSSVPSRLMYYQEDGCWTDFSDNVIAAAKSAFIEQNPKLEVNADGNHYTFDFYRMLQIDVVHGFERSIAWIDINGNCFFPKKFVHVDVDHNYTEIPKIQVEIRFGSNKINNDDDDDFAGSAKRKRAEDINLDSEEDDTATSVSANGEANNKLKKQRLIRLVHPPEVAKWPSTKLMMGWEKAYPVLRDYFLSGMRTVDPDCEITAIRQLSCSGPMEKARWDVFQKQLEITQTARNNARSVSAWYGTSKEGVIDILGHGFRSQSKISGSQSHGLGVYLSSIRSPHISHTLTEPDNNGERHLLLCRVILGNAERVKPGSLQSHPSDSKFDTGADDVDYPKWYVVWSTNMNTHILPMCVVSYKCSKHPQEMLEVTDIKKYLPSGSSVLAVKFLSMLSRNLPSGDAEILKSLCKLYKDGKMAKDSFIRQMRLLAGEQMMLSAIRDCQGSK